ncbi:MAG: F0F1 ATP synthase subunit A [Bacillota bacterium]|nr:F0F1 ATP synthase subunit A [Bacillota bacterium]
MLSIEPAILFHLFGIPIPDFVVVIWSAMAVVLVFAFFATRRLQTVPKGAQNVAELMMGFFEDMLKDMMGEPGLMFFPLIATIGIFTLLLNLSGIIPFVDAPTARLETTFALGIMVFLVSHGYAIKRKGLGTYLKGYIDPYVFMLPLNIIGELGKLLSHSFRLYGNMFGGLVMTFVFYQLVPWVVPGVLSVWFSVFVGVIQSLVFTMLAVAYIQVLAE